jgi:hypothetical protein
MSSTLVLPPDLLPRAEGECVHWLGCVIPLDDAHRYRGLAEAYDRACVSARDARARRIEEERCAAQVDAMRKQPGEVIAHNEGAVRLDEDGEVVEVLRFGRLAAGEITRRALRGRVAWVLAAGGRVWHRYAETGCYILEGRIRVGEPPGPACKKCGGGW